MTDGARPPSRPPRPPRRRLDAPIELFDGQRVHSAVLRNLSTGGAFAAVAPPLPEGTGVSFRVALDQAGVALGLRGHVRWTRSLPGPGGEPVGVGIELFEAPDAVVAQIAAWIAGAR